MGLQTPLKKHIRADWAASEDCAAWAAHVSAEFSRQTPQREGNVVPESAREPSERVEQNAKGPVEAKKAAR